jgi:Cytochrome P450
MWTYLETVFSIMYIVFLIVIYWYMTVPKGLPPGPLGLPFIGSSLDTWNTEKQHILLREWAKKYGPLYKVWIGCKLVLVLGDWNTIQEALVKKGDVFSGRPRFASFQPPGIPHNHGKIRQVSPTTGPTRGPQVTGAGPTRLFTSIRVIMVSLGRSGHTDRSHNHGETTQQVLPRQVPQVTATCLTGAFTSIPHNHGETTQQVSPLQVVSQGVPQVTRVFTSIPHNHCKTQ